MRFLQMIFSDFFSYIDCVLFTVLSMFASRLCVDTVYEASELHVNMRVPPGRYISMRMTILQISPDLR